MGRGGTWFDERVGHFCLAIWCSAGKAGLHPRVLEESVGQRRSRIILETRRKEECEYYGEVMDLLNQIRLQPCAPYGTILINGVSSR